MCLKALKKYAQYEISNSFEDRIHRGTNVKALIEQGVSNNLFGNETSYIVNQMINTFERVVGFMVYQSDTAT